MAQWLASMPTDHGVPLSFPEQSCSLLYRFTRDGAFRPCRKRHVDRFHWLGLKIDWGWKINKWMVKRCALPWVHCPQGGGLGISKECDLPQSMLWPLKYLGGMYWSNIYDGLVKRWNLHNSINLHVIDMRGEKEEVIMFSYENVNIILIYFYFFKFVSTCIWVLLISKSF